MPLSEIYLDMLKKTQETTTTTIKIQANMDDCSHIRSDDVVMGKMMISSHINVNDEDSVPWIEYTNKQPQTSTVNHENVDDGIIDLLNELNGSYKRFDVQNKINNSNTLVVGKSNCEKYSNTKWISKTSDDAQKKYLINCDSMQKKRSNNVGILNFSHFARPAMLANASIQSSACKLNNSNFNTTASCNGIQSKQIERQSERNSRAESTKLNHQQVSIQVKEPNTTVQEDASTTDMKNFGGGGNEVPDSLPSSNIGAFSMLRTNEMVGTSSMCSVNSAETSDENDDFDDDDDDDDDDPPNQRKKRKVGERGHSGYHSQEEQCDSGDTNRPARKRRFSAKRIRVAEVHNLSERRRRDRINAKMRELQDLLPNCNKVDKVSMLGHAIEYLKILKLQIQMMSMGSGMYMAPMMFPPGMQLAYLPHFSPMPMGMPMGNGIGLNFGMGMFDDNNCPFLSVPPVHGPQFRGNFVHGSSSSQLDQATGQRIPILVPRPPAFSLFPMHSARPIMPQFPTTAIGIQPHAVHPSAVIPADHHQNNKKEEPSNKRNPDD